jgi:hypothetical protein
MKYQKNNILSPYPLFYSFITFLLIFNMSAQSLKDIVEELKTHRILLMPHGEYMQNTRYRGGDN